MATQPPADRKLMRDINQNTLLNLIRVHAPVSRPQLAALSGLSMATVLGLTNDLVERRFVQESGPAESTGGRKATLLQLRANGGFAVGLMVRGFMTIGVIVNLQGDVVFSEHWEITLRHEGARGIDLLVECVRQLLQHAELPEDRIIGVGCALSGYINAQAGLCVDSWNLDWHHVEVSQPMSERLNIPVFIANDISCIATYEKLFGRGNAYHHFLTVSLGRGLGLGIVINDEVYRGSKGGGGEFGHTVAVPGGRLCECGKQGCLEEYASFRGIMANYREHPGSLVLETTHTPPDQVVQHEEETIRALFEAAEHGDEAARAAFQRSGELLGIGLANLVNLFNPECIVITSEAAFIWPLLFGSMESALRQYTFSELAQDLRIDIGPPLSFENGARGAGAIVLDRFFSSPARL
ncbi:MAG TPA: ROK family protein [Ktedonosporobacter sp.]|nr:ROK family protein [Ktedonosporobacter sp.]